MPEKFTCQSCHSNFVASSNKTPIDQLMFCPACRPEKPKGLDQVRDDAKDDSCDVIVLPPPVPSQTTRLMFRPPAWIQNPLAIGAAGFILLWIVAIARIWNTDFGPDAMSSGVRYDVPAQPQISPESIRANEQAQYARDLQDALDRNGSNIKLTPDQAAEVAERMRRGK